MLAARPRFHLSIAAVLLGACGGAIPAPEPAGGGSVTADATVLRIVTWNVHDLFDENDRTTAPGDADTVPILAEVEAKLAAVGRVLARIDPDVAVLQEVENEPLLRRLAGGPLAGRGYQAFLREGNDPRGIDVGVLSRVAFTVGPSHLDEREPDGRRLLSRDLLEITVAREPLPIIIVGAHLVSRIDPREDERRLLQATRLRDIADAIRSRPSAPCVLVVGDLNDVPAAPALLPLIGDGAWVDLGRALPAVRAWTWSGSGLHERMDYALIARGDEAFVTRIAVEEGSDVVAASDHRPLVVDVWTGKGGRVGQSESRQETSGRISWYAPSDR